VVRDILGSQAKCFSTTLTEIRLTLSSKWVFVRRFFGRDPFVGVLDGLRILSRRNVLRTICIVLALEDDWRYGKIVQDQWLHAATKFSDLESFPYLKEVSTDVTVRRRGSLTGPRLIYYEHLLAALLELPFYALDLPFKFCFSARLGY